MAARTHTEIEKQVEDIKAKRRSKNATSASDDTESVAADYDISYIIPGSSNIQYDTSIDPSGGVGNVDIEEFTSGQIDKVIAEEREHIAKSASNFDPLASNDNHFSKRKSDYKPKKVSHASISPAREDPFADGGRTPVADSSSKGRLNTYSDIMARTAQQNEEYETKQKIREQIRAGEHVSSSELRKKRTETKHATGGGTEEVPPPEKKSKSKNGFSVDSSRAGDGQVEAQMTTTVVGTVDPDSTPKNKSWEETPVKSRRSSTEARKIKWDESSSVVSDKQDRAWESSTKKSQRKSGSFKRDEEEMEDDTSVTPSRRRTSRWDEAPSVATGGGMTPLTPSIATPTYDGSCSTRSVGGGSTPVATPVGKMASEMKTPSASKRAPMTPEQIQSWMWEQEIDERNRPWTDDELDALFPFDGYKVLQPPVGYQPIRTPTRKLTATPTPFSSSSGYKMPQPEDGRTFKVFNEQPPGDFPALKPDDVQYFEKLLVEVDESQLPPDERKERAIMGLLLKIKNGTPPMRKSALRQITDKAREFGAGPLFNQILPLLMSPTLEDQERHLLVKVIDRILYKLDDLVRPFVHKILVVIEPLLIDEDYYARVEGREIISNLAKAAGLATMISTMRPDIDNIDEYVRNTTARAFAVVASALGVPSLLPFLKAVCKSKKSWQARHTGIKIIQQISILMGCAILPHLRSLVEIIEHGLIDEQQKVRTITALAIAALAEASTPYGIESFDSVLKPLWKGIRQHRGKGLAAFLKAIGYLIPLMDAEYAFHYTKEVVIILIREFPSPDEEMKKIVLKVVKQCCSTDGVEPSYIKTDILPEFFRHFWNHRMALDRRNYRQLVDTTVEIASKVGASTIILRIVDDLKDENESYRKMVLETIDNIMQSMGATDIDSKLEEQLIDGILYSFQEQTAEDEVMLSGFGTIVNTLGLRTKPYLPQICGTILWRLNNKSAKVRQQAADLISRVAPVMKVCSEEKLMNHLGVVLYEYLGEEYPEVLGSILGGLKAIVNVIGMNKMTPPIKDLLPRLTPILKNRHEKVQENCIDLVGRIADRGAEHVSAREWMRICFELLELLKAHKKAIRRATVNTFGYIAKAIGPQDVLATLLNNLKVQERQNRVCTTVAIAIVAETCSPFTVLPALMNEYRVPELNVQNGVLKSLAFLFEYIGEMGKDYVYAVVPLLEDALMDRDLVHRQIASAAVKHVALGVFGFGCEDALTHLMNYVWPNVFETSPHIVNAVTEAIEGFRVGIGPCRVLQYALQGLFHPCRRVRDVYWKIYNMLYVSSQDALVPFYPTIPNTERNTYVRYELYLTI